MVKPFQFGSNYEKFWRYYGEPYSIDELEQIPLLQPLAQELRNILGNTDTYLRDLNLKRALILAHWVLWHNKERSINAELFNIKESNNKIRLLKLKEKKKEEQQKNLLSEQQQLSLIKKQQAQLKSEELRREKAQKNVSLYQNYVRKENEINVYYRQNKIQIYAELHQNRLERIKKAVDVAKNDTFIDAKDKRKLIELKRNYEEKYNVIRAISAKKADGSIDHDVLKKKEEQWKQLDDEFAPQFSNILAKYAKKDHKEFSQILQQESKDKNIFQTKLAHNEKEWQEHLEENRLNFESTRPEVKSNIHDSMNESINSLKQYPLKNLSKEERNEFQNSVDKLIQYKNDWIQIKDGTQVKDLLNKFTKELSIVKKQVDPSSEIFHTLEKEFHLLNEFANCINDDPSFAQKEHNTADVSVKSISKDYRNQMFTLRDQDSKKKNKEIVDLDSTVSFDEENRDKLEKIVSKVFDSASEILDNENSSSKKISLASQLIQLHKDIEPAIRGESISASKFEAFKAIVDDLKKIHPDLNKSVKTLSAIRSLPETSTKPQI